MTKNIFLALIICFFLACKEESSSSLTNNYTIRGTISQIDDGKGVYLKAQENGILVTIDSTIIENGSFEFTGSIDRPIVYGIFVDSLKDAVGLFMENKKITIDVYKDSLASSKVNGSRTNDEYLDFVKRSNQIISKMNVLFPVFQKARAENDVEKLREINNKMQEISNENTAFMLTYAKQHPDSYIGAMALQSVIRIPSIHRDTILKIYNNFSNYVKSGEFAIETALFLETPIKQDSIYN